MWLACFPSFISPNSLHHLTTQVADWIGLGKDAVLEGKVGSAT